MLKIAELRCRSNVIPELCLRKMKQTGLDESLRERLLVVLLLRNRVIISRHFAACEYPWT